MPRGKFLPTGRKAGEGRMGHQQLALRHDRADGAVKQLFVEKLFSGRKCAEEPLGRGQASNGPRGPQGGFRGGAFPAESAT